MTELSAPDPTSPDPTPVAGAVPARLAPFLAQWDYIVEVLTDRLAGLTDEELLWEPAPGSWSVRPGPEGERATVDAEVWSPTGDAAPPRTIAWSMGHLGASVAIRADWLVGEHRLADADFDWPRTAAAAVPFMLDGLGRWRNGLASMTDADLDTVGRSAFPHGLDPELPLMEIVWWVNKELIWHSAEIWFMRDLYAARQP